MVFCTFSNAQNWDSYGSAYESEMRMPNIRDYQIYYYNEYELNPADISNKLSDVEKLKNTNKQSNIVYSISKISNGLTKVEIIVNTKTFSEATYKNGLLEGKKTIYHTNGSPFQEFEFKNGKANGLCVIHNEDYQLILETNYKDNIKNGLRRFTFPNRETKKLEGNYVNGNIVGPLKLIEDNDIYTLPNDLRKGKVQHFYNNKLISEFEIINEKDINGDAKVYDYATGKLKVKIPYYLGEKNGFVETFDSKGDLLSKNEYKLGKKIGEQKMLSDNHKLIKEEYYDDYGNKIGTWKTYEKEGLVLLEQNYKNDSLNGISNSFKNGILQSSTEYKNGKRTGLTKYFTNPNNQISSDIIYENDEVLKEVVYYNNGTIFYVNEKNSTTDLFSKKYYDSQGNFLHENQYNSKKNPIGIHKYIDKDNDSNYNIRSITYFDNDGKKTKYITYNYTKDGSFTESNYRNEVLHGPYISFNAKTNQTITKYYFETNRNQKEVTKEEFEKLIAAEKK
jgi:antitoxin component YwqK of YwqJK toxin-antitoxin module